jgi:hypothetical protein
MCSTCVATVFVLIESSVEISAGPSQLRGAAGSPALWREADAGPVPRREALQVPPRPRDELLGVERLGQVVVRSEQKARDTVGGLRSVL